MALARLDRYLHQKGKTARYFDMPTARSKAQPARRPLYQIEVSNGA